MYKAFFPDSLFAHELNDNRHFAPIKTFYDNALSSYHWTYGPGGKQCRLNSTDAIVEVLTDPFYPDYSSAEELRNNPHPALSILKIIWTNYSYGYGLTGMYELLNSAFNKWKVAQNILRKGTLATRCNADLMVQKWVLAYNDLQYHLPSPNLLFRNYVMERKSTRDNVTFQLESERDENARSQLLLDTLTFPIVGDSAIHLMPFFYIKVFGLSLGLKIIRMEILWMKETKVTIADSTIKVSYPSITQSVRPDRLIVSHIIQQVHRQRHPWTKAGNILFKTSEWTTPSLREMVHYNLFSKPPCNVDLIYRDLDGSVNVINDEKRPYVPRVLTLPSYQIALGLPLNDHQVPERYLGNALRWLIEGCVHGETNAILRITSIVARKIGLPQAVDILRSLLQAEIDQRARITVQGQLVVNREKAKTTFPRGGHKAQILREKFQRLYFSAHPLVAMMETNIFATFKEHKIILRDTATFYEPVSGAEYSFLSSVDDLSSSDNLQIDDADNFDEFDVPFVVPRPYWYNDSTSDVDDEEDDEDIRLSSSESDSDDDSDDDDSNEDSDDESMVFDVSITQPVSSPSTPSTSVLSSGRNYPMTSTPGDDTSNLPSSSLSCNEDLSNSSIVVPNVPCLYDCDSIKNFIRHAVKTFREREERGVPLQPEASLDLRIKGIVRKSIGSAYLTCYRREFRGSPDDRLAVCDSILDRFIKLVHFNVADNLILNRSAASSYKGPVETLPNARALALLDVLKYVLPGVYGAYFTAPTRR